MDLIVEYLRTSYAFAIPPILGFFVLSFLCLLSLLRGPRRIVNILFAGICLMGALINLDVALVSIIGDKNLALKIDRIIYVAFVFSPPIYIQFVHAFLRLQNRRRLELVAYLVSLLFLVFVFSDLFISGFHEYYFGTIARAGPVFHVFSVFSFFTVFYCLLTLFRAMQAASDNMFRNRIQYILGGMGMSAFLIALNILPVMGFEIYPMGNFSFIPGVFLAVGVLKYDLLDIGVLIRKGTGYFILTAALTLIYVGIIALFNTLFWEVGRQHPLMLPVMLALLMVLIFEPLRKRVQDVIDRLFFRGRYDYQQLLKATSAEMTCLLRSDEISRLLLDTIDKSLQVSRVCLLLYDQKRDEFVIPANQQGCAEDAGSASVSAAHPLVAYLKEHNGPLAEGFIERKASRFADKQAILSVFADLSAVLLVPVIYKHNLVGIIALGQKKSGHIFVHEDVELLSTLANQSAVALENARMYEALAKINLELEQIVEHRTADLRHALQEKERTQKQLILSESLAAIGQLVAGTAHELNNPLAGASSLIQTSVESIRSLNTAPDALNEVEEDLLFSLKELRRAADIVRSLLDLSRQTQTYEESVNIHDALDDALRILHNQYKSLDIRIIRHYEENLPSIQGNFANIGQVFINILKNAMQAVADVGGIVTIKTMHKKNDDKVIVEIADNGRGIAEAQLKNIFKPFYTTKTVGQGTGLGLYISHEIVIRHEGAIHVQSELDKGTTFSIEIPCRRRKS